MKKFYILQERAHRSPSPSNAVDLFQAASDAAAADYADWAWPDWRATMALLCVELAEVAL